MKIEKTSSDEGYVTVTEEEFLEQIAQGLCCGEILKPGRHKFIRGGFRKLHPDFDPAKAEVRYNITLALPPEIYNYFKQQAEQTVGKSLAAVMEEILIKAVERGQTSDDGVMATSAESLSSNPQFIEAVAERVKKLSKKSSAKSSKPAPESSSANKPRRRAA